MTDQQKNAQRDKRLIKRYKDDLGLPDTYPVTGDMVCSHWDLEIELASRIRESTPEKRWSVSADAYTRFYRELPWLNEIIDNDRHFPATIQDFDMLALIGSRTQRIYEVGSGQGKLIYHLAQLGHTCRGCDITPERGEQMVPRHPNLSFGESDGVHLSQFEPSGAYDLVISDNVLEHLHPDDAPSHFDGAGRILRKGGRYILKTPHRFFGPHGIERVFGITGLKGFHLREYIYRDIAKMARRAGFDVMEAVFMLPSPLRQRLPEPLRRQIRPSRLYMEYLCSLESVLMRIGDRRIRHLMCQAGRFVFLPRQVFMVLRK